MSRLAVAALALGVASLVVFVAPAAAVVVPLAGVAASVAALVRVGRDASLAGRSAAVFGLALSVFALSAGPTFWLVREWQLRRSAEMLAREFVSRLLAGDSRAAHQMTLAARLRFKDDRSLADNYRDTPQARDDLAAFVRDPSVRQLRSLGRGRIEAATMEDHKSHLGVDWFTVEMTIASETDASKSTDARVLVEHKAGPDGGEWRVAKFAVRE